MNSPKTWASFRISTFPPPRLPKEARELRFNNGTTTDDHLAQIVGYKTFGAEEWFLAKDSLPTSWEEPRKGYVFFHASYLDNVTLNEWSAGPSLVVLLYVPVGVSPILNYGGEEWHGATLRVAFEKDPNSQRLFGGCSHGTLP